MNHANFVVVLTGAAAAACPFAMYSPEKPFVPVEKRSTSRFDSGFTKRWTK
jgi:hypothetical protein